MEKTKIKVTPLGDILSVAGQRHLFAAPLKTSAASAAVFGSALRPVPGVQESFLGLDLSAIPAGDEIEGVELTLVDTGNSQGPGPRAGAASRLAQIPLLAEYVDLGGALDVGDVQAVKPGASAGITYVTDAGMGKSIVLDLGPPPRDFANLAVRLSMPLDGLVAGELVRVAYNGGAHATIALPSATATHEAAIPAAPEEPAADSSLIGQLLEIIASLRAQIEQLLGRA